MDINLILGYDECLEAWVVNNDTNNWQSFYVVFDGKDGKANAMEFMIKLIAEVKQ